MAVNREDIQGLIDYPREALAIELKDWFDPQSPEGQTKIVKGCIAMRNHGSGGFFIVGFDNDTLAPNFTDAPPDLRATFHADKMNELVNRYSSEAFEVHVHFPERDGQEFPVLEMESGARTLVAAKRPLTNEKDEHLIERDAVYIRSLLQNNTPSTGKPRAGDWRRILDPLFENREADVGRFLRRNLDRDQLRALSGSAAALAGEEGDGPTSRPELETLNVLSYGHERFQTQKRERNLTRLPRHGCWEVGVVLEGDATDGTPTEEFLNLLNASNPRYTGWPAWIDSRGFENEEGEPEPGPRPYTYDNGWEAFVYRSRGGTPGDRLDFWRAAPEGKFYLYRALRDDLVTGPTAPEPMEALDFGLVITRVAEAIAVPMAFAAAMGQTPEATTLHYTFRWSGLQGREIHSWADPGRFVSPGYICRQRAVDSSIISVSLDTLTSAIAPFVRSVTSGLFAAFSGFEPGPGVTEDLTERLLTRNL